jgi:hypothetical protein
VLSIDISQLIAAKGKKTNEIEFSEQALSYTPI